MHTINKEIDEIHVVFENVEHIKIPYSDVRYISLTGITESMWDSNILLNNKSELLLSKSAKHLYLIIKDKPEYQRIKEYNDITHIEFLSNSETVYYIGIKWTEDSDDYSNTGQEVRVEGGWITVICNQGEQEN